MAFKTALPFPLLAWIFQRSVIDPVRSAACPLAAKMPWLASARPSASMAGSFLPPGCLEPALRGHRAAPYQTRDGRSDGCNGVCDRWSFCARVVELERERSWSSRSVIARTLRSKTISASGFDRLAPHYYWMECVLAGRTLQRCRTAFLEQTRDATAALLIGEGNGRFLAEF